MIENERQYELTKHWADRFRKALSAEPDGMDGLTSLNRAALSSQLESLDLEISEWKVKQSGQEKTETQ